MQNRQFASIVFGGSSGSGGADGSDMDSLAAASSGSVVSLTPFLTLAREIAALFVPVHLRDEFRAELNRDLMVAARQQYARELLLFPAPGTEQSRLSRRWVWGAATLGSAVSLAGIVALVWYQRRRQAA